jgi:NAD(P)H dehydrogenase (quinone)
MKRAHIVYAHPEPNSFVAAMRDMTKEALEKDGWQTSVTDLQAINFDAVASADDFGTRSREDYLVYPLEQRHAWQNKTLDPQIAAEVEAVRNADLLVLVFPIFWYSVPAQLKGWIDRVFLSGVFYGGMRVYDQGGMRGKRAMVVASLGGRDYMFGPGSIHGDLKDMLKHLLQGTLGYVGYSVHEPFFAYHVPYVENTERTGMLMKLFHAVENIDSRPVLPMPSLDDFDDQFRPKVAQTSST